MLPYKMPKFKYNKIINTFSFAKLSYFSYLSYSENRSVMPMTAIYIDFMIVR